MFLMRRDWEKHPNYKNNGAHFVKSIRGYVVCFFAPSRRIFIPEIFWGVPEVTTVSYRLQ